MGIMIFNPVPASRQALITILTYIHESISFSDQPYVVVTIRPIFTRKEVQAKTTRIIGQGVNSYLIR